MFQLSLNSYSGQQAAVAMGGELAPTRPALVAYGLPGRLARLLSSPVLSGFTLDRARRCQSSRPRIGEDHAAQREVVAERQVQRDVAAGVRRRRR